MTELELAKDKIGYLSDILEQLYDMTCLEDMINDLRSGEDDEMLLCNLSLKSEVMDVLENRKATKDQKSLLTKEVVNIKDLAQKLKHNGLATTNKHYVKTK